MPATTDEAATLLLSALEAFPDHHANMETPDEMCNRISTLKSVPAAAAMAAVSSAISLLTLFDALQVDEGRFKLRNQIANYFRISLIWFMRNHQPLATNWERLGASRELSISHLLDSAPYLLRIMEERRLLLSKTGIDARPSREQHCSVILIKGRINAESCLLHQWDQGSERYQLIGGKCRPGESYLDTARREFKDEIADHALVYGRDYHLSAMLDAPVKEVGISRTYGALSEYSIMPFMATLTTASLRISAADRWVGLDEARRCRTNDGQPIAPFVTLLEAAAPNVLDTVPTAVVLKKKRSLQDAIELKPGIWGLRFDLKKWFRGGGSE